MLYSDLVDFFFDRMDLNFRAILVDKNRYVAEKMGVTMIDSTI